MSEAERAWDKAYLRDKQYQNSRNLDARAGLHRRFSINQAGWHPWVITHLRLKPGDRVLECGGGPGWLWRGQTAMIPSDCRLMFTDFSPGMVAEARASLQPVSDAFTFRTADIETLPFADDAFDAVVANHMLYHTTDLNQALGEVRRVLAPHGRFYAATNGAGHMKELSELGRTIAAATGLPALTNHRFALSFRLENGQSLLAGHFDQVRRHDYPDGLRVTDPEAMLDYLASMSTMEAALLAVHEEALAIVERALDAGGGVFVITKETGLFEAWSHVANTGP